MVVAPTQGILYSSDISASAPMEILLNAYGGCNTFDGIIERISGQYSGAARGVWGKVGWGGGVLPPRVGVK